MLSAQCDKLRRLANHLDERERGMDEYVHAMLNAADNIWHLRNLIIDMANENDDLKAEKARLRGLVRKVERFERTGCYECPYAGCGAGTLYDDDCPMRQEIKNEKRALGIEVVDDS